MNFMTDSQSAMRQRLRAAPNIYVANFGISNVLWSKCLKESCIETFSHLSALAFLQKEDRAGYIANAMENEWTAAGLRPIKATASRWYTVSKIFETTAADIWIHRSQDDIWWTISLPDPHSVSFHKSHAPEAGPGDEVFHTRKATLEWSCHDLAGRRLSWKGAHPKARHFLSTEATVQKISDDYAAYALEMILGGDLSSWHSLEQWKQVLEDSKRGEVSIATATQKAAYEMALTAWNTTQNSNGQVVERTVKEKNFDFESVTALEAYIHELLYSQEGFCAISGLPFQFRDSSGDPAMFCSLDRIDSDGHYARGNLQVVCRFINKWKSNTSDEEFRRLFRIAQTSASFT